MKWTNGIKNKMLASAILFSLCALVLVSNYLDGLHNENVKKSISSLYDDRLVVEEYLLKMTKNIYEIREFYFEGEYESKLIDSVKFKSETIIETFEKFSLTNLTELENIEAKKLKFQINALTNGNFSKKNILTSTKDILVTLNLLSDIQLDESTKLMKEVESEYAMFKLLSQLGFAIVFLILIVLQILVFSGESILPVIKTKNPSLN